MRNVAIECGLCRSGRAARAEVWCRPGCDESKMASAGRGGKTVPLGYEEPISCDAKCGMVMESTPVTAFKVSQPQFLFQFLIVAFDDPAVFGHFDQSLEAGIRRQRRYPVLRRFGVPSRPFDQQPFLRVWFRFPVVPMRRTNANGGKTGLQLTVCTLTPGDFFKGDGRQSGRQLPDGDGLMIAIACAL
jgi:hypothetical protein